MRRTLITTPLMAIFSVLITVVSAWALSLDEAKTQGLVGERRDGYLGAVSSNSPEVSSLVSQINDARRASYAEIAKKNNVTVASVEALAAQKAIDQTKKGNFFQTQTGGWTKK